MRSVDGIHRRRPLASTSTSSERSRIAKKASVSAGRVGSQGPRVKGQGRANAGKECVDSRKEITEEPNSSSSMGLSQPTLIAYEEGIIDATNRGAIMKKLVNLISLLLIAITSALIVATFVGVPTSGLIIYAKWLGALLIPLLSTAVGYYFGRTQSKRHQG
jgi:hypothetical protein